MCVSGSAPLLLDIKQKFEALTAATGGRLRHVGSAHRTHVNPIQGLNNEAIGVPIPDVEARIISLDDEVTPLPQGEIGELVVRGPEVMFGYHAIRPAPERAAQGSQ